MKQVVCECGRIAEVRRRSNGQKLRYKHCKCGTSLGGVESAVLLERKEQDDIGEWGEFHGKAETDEKSISEAVEAVEEVKSESAPASSEWVPDEEVKPDEGVKEKAESGGGMSGVAKAVGVGALVAGILGVAGIWFTGLEKYK